MSRGEYLRNLRSFIQSSSDAIKKFSEEMGWHEPHGGARLLRSSLQDQVVGNALDSQNRSEYSDEPLLPSASLPSSSSANFTVTLDANTQRNLLLRYKRSAGPDTRRPPTSAGELTANFTSEERLAMYEYTLQNAAGVATPQEILPLETTNPVDSQPKELSGLELKKAMRDFKRRRQAYRTKVSTKNKSQTQVTRELIHNMMMYLGIEEQEHETVHAEGDSTSMSKPGSYQQSIEEGKNLTCVPRHLYGKRDGRVHKHYYAQDRREYEDGDCWNGGQKSEREYDTSSYRRQMEKEYGPEGNRDKRKYNSKRKQDAEYHKTYYKDKRYKSESRWNKSEERSRGRKYDRYSENESYLKNSSEHSYLRLQDDVHVPVKEHTERSTKAIAKLQRNKDESVKLERNVASFKCTTEKIKEEDRWDKRTEKRKGEKEENTTEGEISSHDSQSSYSERDHKAGSSKHRKKQKLKRKKMKRKHKKKRKHRKDYNHRWHESESEESENDKDYRYKISKTDVNDKDYRYKMGKTEIYVKEESSV